VLGVAGLQSRLLSQLQRFDRGRRSTMIFLELDGELAAADVDVGAARRPAVIQPGVDADDLPDRPLRPVGARAFSKPHPKPLAEVLLQCGVVSLRRGNICLEEHASVDGQPAPVEGLHLVGDRDMGVQVRVTGTTVPVGERGRHQAPHLDLPDPVGA